MAVMVRELYEALKDAGADDAKAQKAAEAVADFDKRANDLRVGFVEANGKVTTLQWMVGVNITLTVGLLFLSFNILNRLP